MSLTTPKDYQLEGALKIREWGGRALLADEMGLGKTLQALYYCFKKKKARPIVVVCPASLKYNWEREAAKHVGMLCEVVEGRKPPRRKPMALHPIIVINYEILHWWVPFLQELDVQVVIIDEAHYIKNRESQRYKAVKALCEGVPHVIGISGTPLTNNPSELWPVLSIIRPDKYSSFFKYAFKFCKPKKLPWGWVYTGARNLDVLHDRLLRQCMIRRLKKDVLKDLPPKVRQLVPVGLSSRREYNEATDDFIGWLRKQDTEKARKAKKSKALVQVGYLLRLIARLKLNFVYEWIDNYLESSDEKLVVFTGHRKMVELLHERYGKKCVVVDGAVKGLARQKAVDRFQKDAQVRVFVGNFKAAGVGLTLTAATACAFADLPWTPGDLVQCEDRIHRIGQKSTAFIYYLVARNTIEEKMCRMLQTKQTILEGVLDGAGNGDDLDIFDELLKSVTKKGLIK